MELTKEQKEVTKDALVREHSRLLFQQGEVEQIVEDAKDAGQTMRVLFNNDRLTKIEAKLRTIEEALKAIADNERKQS